jgi:hypothetical protein
VTAEFSITTASNQVVLDDLRRGHAAFTVQNESGRAISASGRVVVQPPAQAAWLAVAEPVQRAFAPGEAQAYGVDLVVPNSAPDGDYAFHLEMVDVANPDDFVSPGPGVTFHVSGPVTPPPPPQRAGYLATVAGAMVGAFVLGLLAMPFSSPPAEYAAQLVGAVAGAAGNLRWRGYAGAPITAGILAVCWAVWSALLFGVAGRFGPLLVLAAFPAPLVARGAALWRLGSFTWPWGGSPAQEEVAR